MDRRKQETLNALNGGQFNIQPSGDGKSIIKIIMYFTGTNAAATVSALSDLGSIVVNRNGEPLANVKIATLAEILDINRGQNYLESVSGAAFAASAILYLYEEDFESGLEIIDDKELNFEYVAGSSATFADLSVAVYAEYSDWPELMEVRTLRENQTFSGALAAENFPLNKNNITSIYLKDVNDVVSSVSLLQNGRQVLSEQPFILLKIDTLAANQLEVTDFDLVKVRTHTPGVVQSTINRDSNLALTTSGAGAVEITTVSMVWN